MTGFLLSLAAGILPMVLYAWFLFFLDRYEKEPLKLLVGTFLWGSLIAAGGAFAINSISSLGILFLTQSELAAQLATSALIAPVVEETLKGSAVLIVFLLFKPEFDSPLDGIIYAGIVALGFAATENIWYIHQLGYLQNGLAGLKEMAFIRVFLVGWQHPFYTAFTGYGFGLARGAREPILRWIFPILGWTFAVIFHLIHNLFAFMTANSGSSGLLNTLWDWSGYLGLLVLILLLIAREKRWMREHLESERSAHLLSAAQFEIACSARKQSLAYIHAFFRGDFRETRSYYQLCGDLMHKKRQLIHHGDDPATASEIQRLRSAIGNYHRN